MHPIRGAAIGRILRTAAAEIEDRRAVAPGIEDRHAGMLQTDDVVQPGRHDLTRRAGIAVGQRHRDLFVRAHDDFGPFTGLEVNDRVVEAAVARARIQRDVFNAQIAQHFDHEIGAVLRSAFPPDPRRPDFRIALRLGFFCHISSKSFRISVSICAVMPFDRVIPGIRLCEDVLSYRPKRLRVST